jgi:hypothetical protein
MVLSKKPSQFEVDQKAIQRAILGVYKKGDFDWQWLPIQVDSEGRLIVVKGT